MRAVLERFGLESALGVLTVGRKGQKAVVEEEELSRALDGEGDCVFVLPGEASRR